MPSRKVDPLILCIVHGYFLSVAIILCNKMDFSFGAITYGWFLQSQSHNYYVLQSVATYLGLSVQEFQRLAKY